MHKSYQRSYYLRGKLYDRGLEVMMNEIDRYVYKQLMIATMVVIFSTIAGVIISIIV